MTGRLQELGGVEGERDRRMAVTWVAALLVAGVLAVSIPHSTLRSTSPATLGSAASAQAVAQPRGRRMLRLAVSVSRRFLSGYLPYSYGQAPATAISDAAPGVISALDTAPLPATSSMRARHPKVVALTPATTPSGQITVSVLVDDGPILHYTLRLLLRGKHGWLLVTGLESQ